MKNKNIIYIASTLLVLILSQSCGKYLEVTPKSSVAENELYTSEAGFQQALSGAYAQMASRDSYGDLMTMSFVSVLGKNYNTSAGTHRFVNTGNFDYQSDEVTGYTTRIWTTSYKAIAALNNIIEQTQEKRNLLSSSAYSLIRGEALALRAYLHFDLLRLFGKSYVVGAQDKAIPYRTQFTKNLEIPSTTERVIQMALADIEDAMNLLKESDPIFSSSPNRQVKMNYYAAKGLQARIKLYMGDEDGAYAAAKEVIDSGKFPFVVLSAVAAASNIKDRLFKSELIFTLRVRDMVTWIEDSAPYFKFYMSPIMGLTLPEGNQTTLFEGLDADVRKSQLWDYDEGVLFPAKYWQTSIYTDSLRLDQLVPLIRVSEMYYIMAETAPTLEESLDIINLVRTARGLKDFPLQPVNLTKDYIRNELTKEYAKEFYAEGQLFYYYKRLNSSNMLLHTPDINPVTYLLPIPPDELEFNPNY